MIKELQFNILTFINQKGWIYNCGIIEEEVTK